ncbi:RelA/SpoT family protein [Vibrio parahaemolyticus]|uniref:RelA/SpoT family protein n=8 Tax=Vibrio parahaemolyticus TaxID=670 RepID=A0A7Y0S461_VIBPH|nr:RelA/SpoT family protein [Vibrio parahaemolyticus]AKU57230.1 RelA/SpoT [Vibrio parahaemolyticus]APE86289.1 RelA/SpoT [Vibrio parahaemolyticus]EGQ8163748.1 RelA/SpoT family protein [Vibrio parahaemolyticus]EGQ9820809.1 RelA/SpoT family protein [Vibrio parahaemolyticus]EGR0995201.1 RelA/SpoT family protein [Vibrio parahaemolyticus]
MSGNYEQVLAKSLQATIESELDRLGLLFRVFSRAKSKTSIESKIESKGVGYYSADGKKIQDLFGVRIALYFPDDINIARQALEKLYPLVSQEVDPHDASQFQALRCNFVFKLPETIVQDSQIIRTNELVDRTFEVQLRTVLSEGWHEVEHDLRYKCKEDWEKHADLNRALNGIYASLETSDWGMMRLFEDLTYRHYKAKEWAPMLRNKFRLRTGNDLSLKLENIIGQDDIGKLLYRLDRTELILKILNKGIRFPLTINTLVYIANYYYIRDSRISNVTPTALSRALDELELSQ